MANPKARACGLTARRSLTGRPTILAFLLFAVTLFGQQQTPRILDGGLYRAPRISPFSLADSARADSLIRAGQLYLSLPDAISIALENNLDIAIQRYDPPIAGTDLLRAKGGGDVRGVPLVVTELPQSVITPVTPLVNAAASGLTTSSNVSAAVPDIYPVTGPITTLAINGGTSTTSAGFAAGPPVPMYDPALTGSLMWQHATTPETNTALSGTSALIQSGPTGMLGYAQGFSPGTQLSVDFSGSRESINSVRSIFNPYSTSSLGFTVTQPLLRGFGPAVNRRFIRIAKIDQRISDYVFREQVIATVSGVIRLYYDLVSLNEDLHVKRQTLGAAQRLYDDNKSQVEAGTLAPIELVRAQAQVAAARQDLTTSEGYVLQQELLLKTVLTKRGTADPLLRAARIVPTSPISIPATDETRPVDQLLAEAFANRPDVAASRLQVDGARVYLEGSRNELLPELNVVGFTTNTGLAGTTNSAFQQTPGVAPTPPASGTTGGLGTSLDQVFSSRYPTYGAGIQLNLPLRNRVAEADVERDEIEVRQFQIRAQQIENQVRLEIENALIVLQRAREELSAATQSRELQEQSLALEHEKFAVGLSTTFLITEYQAFVAQARSTEVAARSAYVKARNALERAVGKTLENNNVSIDEAMKGEVARPPAAPPATPSVSVPPVNNPPATSPQLQPGK